MHVFVVERSKDFNKVCHFLQMYLLLEMSVNNKELDISSNCSAELHLGISFLS